MRKEDKLNKGKKLKSKSKCFSYLKKYFADEDGMPYEGVREISEGLFVRFVNGYIDGNVYDKNGIIVARQPAMEYENEGMEFWLKGTPSGSPAVIQDGGKYEESWKGGTIRKVEININPIPKT